MKALVIFDTFFNNTEKIAEAVGKGLGAAGEVTVASSDRTLQGVVSGFGARTLDARSMLDLAKEALLETREDMRRMGGGGRNPLEDRVSEEVRRLLDEMRYG